MEQQSKNSNNYLIPISIIIAALLVAGAFLLSKNSSFSQFKPSKLKTTKEEVTKEEQKPENIEIDFEGWPTIGDPTAPVVMVEYSDFACPFCGRFWRETLPSIKRDYIDKGKVRLVYKDFTVVGGERAAEAAHCAQEQGKFWEYHDLLFERQAEDRDNWSDPNIHRAYAKELGLDENALVSCFESRRYQEKVAASTQEAMKNGGQGTPYFFINGKPVFGAQPYSAFQTVIDLALNES